MMCSEFLIALARRTQVLKTVGLLSDTDFNEIKKERMCKVDQKAWTYSDNGFWKPAKKNVFFSGRTDLFWKMKSQKQWVTVEQLQQSVLTQYERICTVVHRLWEG